MSESNTTRRIARHQARSSREGGLFLNHSDRIKLSHASLKNTMLANRQAKRESGAGKAARKHNKEHEKGTHRSR
jgi:hypothetical protein